MTSDEFPFGRTQSASAQAPSEVDSAPFTSPPAERRRAVRQTLVAKAAIRNADIPAAARSIFVNNISMLGIGFQCHVPLSVGQRHDVGMEIGPMRWSSRVRVVSCAPNSADSFDIGAEFVGNELNRRAA